MCALITSAALAVSFWMFYTPKNSLLSETPTIIMPPSVFANADIVFSQLFGFVEFKLSLHSTVVDSAVRYSARDIAVFS